MIKIIYLCFFSVLESGKFCQNVFCHKTHINIANLYGQKYNQVATYNAN